MINCGIETRQRKERGFLGPANCGNKYVGATSEYKDYFSQVRYTDLCLCHLH